MLNEFLQDMQLTTESNVLNNTTESQLFLTMICFFE